jgi:hypothetical protein
MATYPTGGQFGEYPYQPMAAGGANAAARFQTNPGTAVPGTQTPNPWMQEMQNVLSGFGFKPGDWGKQAGGINGRGNGNGNGALNWSPDVNSWIASATGGGGTDGMNSPAAAIKAALPGIYEEQTRSFGNAAQKMGQTGMLASSPYMEALGRVSRKSSGDIASLTENMYFQAAESASQRQMQRDLALKNLQMQAASMGANRDQASWQQANANNQNGMSNQMSLANLIGDWYNQMRNTDENRSMSQWQIMEEQARQEAERARLEAPGNPVNQNYGFSSGYGG